MEAPTERNPYEVLGVPRDCSPEDIRSAYRRLAAQLHPDQGGGRGEFEQVTWAKELLLDPKRRDQYDRLGTTRTAKEMEMKDKVLHMVNSIISSVLDADDDETTTDVVGKIKSSLANAVPPLRENLRVAKRKLKRAKNVAKRMRRKAAKRGDEPDFLENILRQRVSLAERSVLAAEDAIQVHTEVIKFWDDYAYERDGMPVWDRPVLSGAHMGARSVKRTDLDPPV